MVKNRKGTMRQHQLNMKCTEKEFSDVQQVNHEFFGGDLNKSDLMRFLVKVALTAIDNAKVEVKTVKTLRVGGKVVDLT